ncbi:hypothetical protein SAMN05661096_00219 [Marivirga sericea]|uniref:Outer membrane protein beta-barrel family protein n=1 Tax=Marivirga sericea TaxID=1028 RepID=A0A1X7I4X0_9BACT|nr:hypothetical protein SAMN05661096_00219 [Marivirga sericea]
MFSQNLESIGKENPITVSGGVSVNQIFYANNGLDSRRDPYSFFASGNINFDLYGWSVPLSFAYSNQQVSFQQPFNQYSVNPTYKWISGHFGFTNMNFSPYTLGGHNFLGAGVEARPGKWQVSAMYGRLLAPVQPDSTSETRGIPSFRRMGWGVKAGYADGQDQLHFIIFNAKDDVNSIDYVPEEEDILPEENLVISLIGSKKLFSRVVLNAEYSISGITRDTRTEAISPEEYRFFNNVGGLFQPRISTGYYNAFNSGINYQADAFTVGVGLERIDPGYRTLGAYFFNNDLINYTVNAATSIFSGKVNLAGNIGLQKDNLDGEKVSTMERTVGSINVGFAASEKLNISTSYSNFTSFTNIRSQFVDINQLTPYDNLDTLNFTQISQNASVNGSYILQSSEDRRQNLNVNFSFQDAADQQGGVEQNSGSQFYLMNASYSLSLVPKSMTISGSFNYNENKALNNNTRTLGPTLAINQSFLDKALRATLSSSYNSSFSNGDNTANILNIRSSGSYSIKKKHNINLGLAMVNRQSKRESATSDFTEFTATLGYSYNFSSR